MPAKKLFLLCLTLAALLVPGVASASTPTSAPIPQCTDISFTGSTGQINIRTSPSRNVAWNIAMHDNALNDGPWTVDVFVNNRREDHKVQNYQPHGSIASSHIPENSFISIEAFHTDLKGTEHFFVPNQCIVP